VPPRMTQTEINNIPTPLEGAIVFNTTLQSLYTFNGTEWQTFVRTLPSIMDRGQNGVFTLAVDTYYQFPVTSSNITYVDSDYFTYVSTGKIRVLQAGIYNITAGISSSNLPAGERKYVIGVYKNNTLVGYLNRGVVDLPEADFWGVSGAFTGSFAANDEIDLRYVLNRDSTSSTNQTAPIRFVNLSITKLN